jgi:putative glutamine amidotransferase
MPETVSSTVMVIVAAARLEPGRVDGWHDAAEAVPEEYLAGLRRSGLTPVAMGPTAGPEVAEAVGAFAGLVLVGGGDVDPETYDAPRHPATRGVDGARDRFEIELVRAALSAHRPVFAICRGMQVLNVAAGGTLCQHVPDLGGSLSHRASRGEGLAVHPVRVAPASRLAAAVDGPSLTGCASIHHQAVAAVAPPLVATAWSDDGLVEAVETRAPSLWCLGVQWHPERTAAEDDAQQRLFDAFAAAAGRPGRVRAGPTGR